MRKPKPKLLTERLWLKRVHPTPLIRHLEAHHIIRQKEPTRRKRVTFIVAVCRRLFPLLDRPYIAKSSKKLVDEMEKYAQGSITAEELDSFCFKWRHLKMIGFWSMFDANDPLSPRKVQSLFDTEDEQHEKKLRTQDLSQEMRTRVHSGTQSLTHFAWDFEYAKLECFNCGVDNTEYLIRGCLAAAIAIRGIDAAAELTHQCRIIRDIFGNPFHKPPQFEKRWRTTIVMTMANQMYKSGEFSAMPILADALQDAGCDNEEVLKHCRETNAMHVRGCWAVDLVLGKK